MTTVLVSGSLAFDRIMDFPGLFRDHFVEGKLHNINVSFVVDHFDENRGGTAGNIAYNLALLNLSPRIVSAVGDDFASYRSALEAIGVNVSSVRVIPGEKTAAAHIITDKADNQITAFYPGALLQACDSLLVLDGVALAIVAPGNMVDMESIPRICADASIPFFYDPGQQIAQLNGEQLKAGITGAVAVFANDYEFGMISQKTGWAESDVLRSAKVLIVTLGEKGCRVITPESEVRVSAVPLVEVADPTGAGDAFRAGYAAGFLKGLSPKVCARVGSVTASFAVEKQGTQTHQPTLADIARRYASTYGESFPV